MERKSMIRIVLISAAWLMLLLSIPETAIAQTTTYLNDKSKTYQLRSMENGKWEFHPGLYYITLHKDYSGGYWKGLNIRWSENKSNVKQIEPVRASEIALEAISATRVQNQIDSIEPLSKEETLRSAERMADAAYLLYESKFKESFDGIDELTKIANEKSKGELLEAALDIIDAKDLIMEEIEYIHETGPTRQMEQAKRQLAYEAVLKKLEKLYRLSYKLAYYAVTLNNLNK